MCQYHVPAFIEYGCAFPASVFNTSQQFASVLSLPQSPPFPRTNYMSSAPTQPKKRTRRFEPDPGSTENVVYREPKKKKGKTSLQTTVRKEETMPTPAQTAKHPVAAPGTVPDPPLPSLPSPQNMEFPDDIGNDSGPRKEPWVSLKCCCQHAGADKPPSSKISSCATGLHMRMSICKN